MRRRLATALGHALLAAALLAGSASCAGGATGSSAGAGPAGTADAAVVETNATVVRVVDGDTVVVDRGGGEQTVRLIGIDTPETKKPGTPIECFGKEATAHLEGLLPAGAAVRLERDAEEKDRYDRVLAYVFRADGLFVNLRMVEDGYAAQLTVPPNVAHVDRFGAAAKDARDQGKGLWGACGGNHVAG